MKQLLRKACIPILLIALFLALFAFYGVFRSEAQGSPISIPETPQEAANLGKNVWQSIKAWFQGIGIDIVNLIRLLGDFLIAIFDALGKLVRWIIAAVS